MHRLLILFVICSLFSCALNEEIARIRHSPNAGNMYPSDRYVLNEMLNQYISVAEKDAEKINDQIVGLISPHAGYEYSGQVAAYGYSQIKYKEYSRIYIIGTSHNIIFKGIAVYPAGSWETPLGSVNVDETATDLITKNLKFAYNFPAAFDRDHTIEMQLPFLQKVSKNFKIVPILFGDVSESERKQFADYLANEISKNKFNTLVIASSDMSHYKPYEYTVNTDNSTIRDIKKLDTDKLFKDLKNKNCELCGYHGVLALMDIAKQLGLKIKLLKYANSGDVTQNRSSVVGYSSIAFYYPSESQNVDTKIQSELLRIARASIIETFRTGKTAEIKSISDLSAKQGLFVTIKKGDAQRGCIGHIKPDLPISQVARDMAVSAAFKDPRYPPLSTEELSEIRLEISLLSSLKEVQDVNEIQVGTHGLYLCKDNICGILLPQVASAYKWTREDFLEHVSVKAGFSKDAWKDGDSKIYVFTAQVFSE